MKNNATYLKHILEAVNHIEDFTNDISPNEFLNNVEKQFAVIKGIEIIGEAIKNIPLEIREKHPQVPWKEITGTRDIMIHAYFTVDLNLVWKIVEIHLPVLKQAIQNILKDQDK
ncbi:DUF86 domain-containing protein [Candidatus Woesearchaeota archaeon]|nr:DUF86 domain-containing protein [Candidatus Woesearchaeota archaeon]